MKGFVTILFLFFFILASCNKKELEPEEENPVKSTFIRGADISSFPEIRTSNPVFTNKNGVKEDFITILKNAGVNTVRLRIWVNPPNGHSGFNEVKSFAAELKAKGFKTWLTLHYSDTWADPGKQNPPEKWKNLPISALKDSVYNYTARVAGEIKPDYIQIGNEINAGLLFPSGKISENPAQFKELVRTGIQAVKDKNPDSKIIIHFAGFQNADWFFSQIESLSYDIIGLSYYPFWHGKNLESLKSTMKNLSEKYNREIVLAETAYPFTLGYNDWTNNIVGLDEHLILPTYPATAAGQKEFISEIKRMSAELDKGIGFCYWGAELIAWKGKQAADGSPWENLALFDFDNKALPVLDVFAGE